MIQLIENTTKEEAERIKMETINSIEGLNSHNARHWSLSWPTMLTTAEIHERVQSAEVVIESFRKMVVQVLGTSDSKVATVGFILTKPHLHCHLIMTASRSAINTTKESIKKIESIWLDTIGNTAKCTPAFDAKSWPAYLTDFDNIRRKNQEWIPLSIHNPRLLDRKARHSNRNLLKSKMKLKQAA